METNTLSSQTPSIISFPVSNMQTFHYSKIQTSIVFSSPFRSSCLILDQRIHKRSEILNIRPQTSLLPILHLPLLALSSFLIFTLPGVNLSQQLPDRRHAQGVKLFHPPHVNWHADSSRAGMNDKRRLEQMVQFLTDLGIETRVRVLETNVLLDVDELLWREC